MSEEEIVQFWFEDIAHSRWFVKDAEFDRQFDHWHDTAMGSLAAHAGRYRGNALFSRKSLLRPRRVQD